MNKQLTTIAEENGLEKTQAQVILGKFTNFFEQAKEWETKAKTLVITDISQVEEMKQAREGRLILKKIRTEAENTRKDLKERSLREGKAIDGIANVIKALIVPIEEHLEKQEKFIENIENERKEKINADRIAQLVQYVGEDVNLYNLKEMSQEGFVKLLETSKIVFESQKEAEKKAEEERIKKEKEEKAEQERIKKENDRLKKEAEAREKELVKERAEQEKKLEVERQKARLEAEAREKAEAELYAKQKIEEDKKQEAMRVAEENKERAKDERYKIFLKENGYDTKTKHLFHIEKVVDEVRLYKIIGTFNIN